MEDFDWLVVGAGPAGIAVVGKLLDAGVSRIGWVDLEFRVGDLGAKWQNVPGNTRVELFLRYLKACSSFEYRHSDGLDAIDPQETCLLREVCAPLQAVTDRLRGRVGSVEGVVESLRREGDWWVGEVGGRRVRARRVALAIGAEPKRLEGAAGRVIPLEWALNPERLEVGPGDVVGVFGSSHSAVLALANVLERPVERVYNFYRTPHRYAVYYDGWILYDDTGLKGFAAKWAREFLDERPPERLHRMVVSDPLMEESLALCNKVIYAIGFEARGLVGGSHCTETGRIGPGLFGCGIAFPQVRVDPRAIGCSASESGSSWTI